LFDLKSVPKEEDDVAPKHPDVVKQMASQHASWKQTLAPLGKVPEDRERDKTTDLSGHGWASPANR
jgi:hypothetical protein